MLEMIEWPLKELLYRTGYVTGPSQSTSNHCKELRSHSEICEALASVTQFEEVAEANDKARDESFG